MDESQNIKTKEQVNHMKTFFDLETKQGVRAFRKIGGPNHLAGSDARRARGGAWSGR
jgi:hypothetical protein